MRPSTPSMRTFSLIWFGQMISLIGSGLTDFALGVWVYQRTGSVTQFALIHVSMLLPGIVILPLVGVLVDRWDRRWMMIFNDVGAGISTLVIALLVAMGRLEIWHIYVAVAVNATFSGIQWTAYSAVTTLLVPKEHYGRASGMVDAAQSAAYIISPALAGVLLTTIQIQGVLLIDVVTLLVAVSTLVFVRIPAPPTVTEEEEREDSLLREATRGWTFIAARRGLLALLAFIVIVNFAWGMAEMSITPMVLSFASAVELGFVSSAGSIGTLVGSIVMSTWGGPKRRIYGILGFMVIEGLALALMGLRPEMLLITMAYFVFCFAWPITGGCSQAIWLSKVAPDVQGRVFAVRRAVATVLSPLAYLAAGLLADGVLKSLVDTHGLLAESVGQVIGVGPGRGNGLLIMMMGLLIVLATVVAYFYPRLRLLENELPDAIVETVPTQVKEGDNSA